MNSEPGLATYTTAVARRRAELEREGWTHVTRDKVTLPPSLAGFEFDLVMLDEERMLLCQVKSRASARSRDLEAIAAAARTARNITFDIIWFGDVPDLPPREGQVREYAARALILLEAGQSQAALMMAWGALEGAVEIYAADIGVAQPDAATGVKFWELVTRLRSTGDLGERDYERLSRLYRLRNEVAHKLTPEEPLAADVEFTADLARRLLAREYVPADQIVEWAWQHYADLRDQYPAEQAREQLLVLLRTEFPTALTSDLEEAADVLGDPLTDGTADN